MFDHSLFAFETLQHIVAIAHFAPTNQLFAQQSSYVPINWEYIRLKLNACLIH